MACRGCESNSCQCALTGGDNVSVTGAGDSLSPYLISLTNVYVVGGTDVAVADGGTGASNASDARTNLGLGTIATQDASNVTITGGSVTGITDITVADGGTGASTAADARTNLGLVIGTDVSSQSEVETKADKLVTVNAQVGTTYTLVLSDADKLVTLTNASPIALTVPTNASVAFPVGTKLDIAQMGAGQVTVAGDGGVTVNGYPGLLLAGQYAAASLIKLATDTWLLVGALAV